MADESGEGHDLSVTSYSIAVRHETKVLDRCISSLVPRMSCMMTVIK